jgi:hypothetical protein
VAWESSWAEELREKVYGPAQAAKKEVLVNLKLRLPYMASSSNPLTQLERLCRDESDMLETGREANEIDLGVVRELSKQCWSR